MGAYSADRVDGSLRQNENSHTGAENEASEASVAVQPYSLQRRSEGLRAFPPLASSLFVLDLTDNQLEVIPSLQDVPSLRVLRLSHNSISTLESLSDAPQLRELSISHNRLQTIDGVSTLAHLQVLDVRFNDISSNESLRELRKNTALKHIILSGNKATTYPGFGHLCTFLSARLPNLDVRSMCADMRKKLLCENSKSRIAVDVEEETELSDMSEANDGYPPEHLADDTKLAEIESGLEKVADNNHIAVANQTAEIVVAQGVAPNCQPSLIKVKEPVEIAERESSVVLVPRRPRKRVPKTPRKPRYMANTVSRRMQVENPAKRDHLLRSSMRAQNARSGGGTSRLSNVFRVGGGGIQQVPLSYLQRSSVPTVSPRRTLDTRQRAVSQPVLPRQTYGPHTLPSNNNSIRSTAGSYSTRSPFDNVLLAGDIKCADQTADKVRHFRETRHVVRSAGHVHTRATQHCCPPSTCEKPLITGRVHSTSSRHSRAAAVAPRRFSSSPHSSTAAMSRSPRRSKAHKARDHFSARKQTEAGSQNRGRGRAFPSPKVSLGLHSDTSNASTTGRGKRAHSFPTTSTPMQEELEHERDDDVSEWLPRASRDAAKKKSPIATIGRTRPSVAFVSDSDSGASVNAEVQGALKTLHQKINKLYAWHMIELDVVSRQQLQLNSMKELLSATRKLPRQRRELTASHTDGAGCDFDSDDANVRAAQSLISRHKSEVSAAKVGEVVGAAAFEAPPHITLKSHRNSASRLRTPLDKSADRSHIPGIPHAPLDESADTPHMPGVPHAALDESHNKLCMPGVSQAGGVVTLISDEESKPALRRFMRGKASSALHQSEGQTVSATQTSTLDDGFPTGGELQSQASDLTDISGSGLESSSSSSYDSKHTSASSLSSSAKSSARVIMRGHGDAGCRTNSVARGTENREEKGEGSSDDGNCPILRVAPSSENREEKTPFPFVPRLVLPGSSLKGESIERPNVESERGVSASALKCAGHRKGCVKAQRNKSSRRTKLPPRRDSECHRNQNGVDVRRNRNGVDARQNQDVVDIGLMEDRQLPGAMQEFVSELREELAMLKVLTKRLDGVLRSESEIDSRMIAKLELMCQQCQIFAESKVPSDVQSSLMSNNKEMGEMLHGVLKDLQHVSNEKSVIGEKLARAKAISTSRGKW